VAEEKKSQPAVDDLGLLIDGARSGRKATVDQLFALLYPELRRLAMSHMRRENSAHSWHPTLLVHELYLELLKNRAFDDAALDDDRRRAFMGLAGFLMKRLLIHHSRPLRQRVERTGEEALESIAICDANPESVIFVESLLDRIEAIDPRFRLVIEWRVFHGKSPNEIAAHLGCSERTVSTLWAFCRNWLETELAGEALS
jgi:RNA polymerase sigma factor (TIGR02999 family)